MIDLKVSVDNEMAQTKDRILAFPWEDREAYAMWLAQTYHMVNHSTRLVALAGAYAPLDRNDLHARFVDHSKEERGHQLVAIADMKALGHKVEDFPCLPPSASMYQIQYYWIQHRGAVSFFGYTLSLECLASHFGQELYRRTLGAHGKNASNFLRLHSEDDLEHIEKAFKQVSALSADERVLVQENLEVSAALYRSMLTQIQEFLGGRRDARRSA